MAARCVRFCLSDEVLGTFRRLKREGYGGTLQQLIEEAVMAYAEVLRK